MIFQIDCGLFVRTIVAVVVERAMSWCSWFRPSSICKFRTFEVEGVGLAEKTLGPARLMVWSDFCVKLRRIEEQLERTFSGADFAIAKTSLHQYHSSHFRQNILSDGFHSSRWSRRWPWRQRRYARWSRRRKRWAETFCSGASALSLP